MPLSKFYLPIERNKEKFELNRIFCVGRNYADHVKELGNKIDRDAPIYFTKFSQSAAHSGSNHPYPSRTENYHFEMELVIAIGASGKGILQSEAMNYVFGYGCGLDMTRRDLQNHLKDKKYPWDMAKNFDNSAILGSLTQAHEFTPKNQRITLDQNGVRKQDGELSDMIWSIPEIIADLSTYCALQVGDIIMTGTPAGVGAVKPGDKLIGEIEGLSPVTLEISERA